MNHKQKIKPNLLDPLIEKKIMKTLVQPKDDYWEPAKITANTFYHDYIKKNVWVVIIIILLILFLIYRYRSVKKEREIKRLNEQYTQSTQSTPKEPDISYDDYVELLMELYQQQKENMLEPTIHRTKEHKRAYPIYPNTNGGSLKKK